MKKPAKRQPMPPLMSQVLADIAEGRGAYYGCSEHGGRTRTIAGLYDRGYISDEATVTEAGRAQLEKR